MKNNTKKTILMFGLMTVFLLALSSITTALDYPLLNVTVAKYEPYPAEPNSYVDVWIKVENIGTQEALNVRMNLMPEFPFSTDANQASSKDFGVISVGNAEIVKFKIRVDKDAVQGTNDLKYNISTGYAQDSWRFGTLDIDVQTSDANLAVVEIETEPEYIAPGSTATVKIKVTNYADSVLKDVTLSLDFSTIRSTTTTLYDLPFAPLGTTAEQKISKINPGETRLFQFKIMAYPEATANLYKIPLDISYFDDVGTEYTKEDLIGLVVNSEPELFVSVDDIEAYSVGETGDMILKFINKGLTEIKFLTVTVGESEDFDILSTSNEVYVGNIDSDDYETVDYNIKLLKTGDIEIPVNVKFRDSSNNLFEQDTIIKTKVRSAKELGTAPNVAGAIITWIIIIGLVVLAFWWFKKRKNKKKKA